ncbi:MAG: Uma2 family endonuclease [Gemmatimonadales bacterium]
MIMTSITPSWTVSQRDRLPHDGNRYEVMNGELFLTPMPSWRHQWIADELTDLLKPYVREYGLGSALAVSTDVIRGETDVAVPDVVVYPFTRDNSPLRANEAPRPLLVAEICSATTGRRDTGAKRDLYTALGVPEYWIVDAAERTVKVVRPDSADEVVTGILWWQPEGATRALDIDLANLLR